MRLEDYKILLDMTFEGLQDTISDEIPRWASHNDIVEFTIENLAHTTLAESAWQYAQTPTFKSTALGILLGILGDPSVEVKRCTA